MVSRGGKANGVVLVLYHGVMMGLYSLTWCTDGVALVLYHGVLADGIGTTSMCADGIVYFDRVRFSVESRGRSWCHLY